MKDLFYICFEFLNTDFLVIPELNYSFSVFDILIFVSAVSIVFLLFKAVIE